MLKKTKFANPALKKNKSAKETLDQFNFAVNKSPKGPLDQFNLAVNVNSFNAVFDLQKLEEKEEKHLEEILDSNWIPDNLSEGESRETLAKLKNITSEIKSISRQGAFLIGERVVQAREMLKPYRDGTFTLWVESTFGSRRSGYNMLTYYELFRDLPDETLKNKYKMMPQRAAYSLANRKGDIQKKIEIIDKYFDLKSNELISIVQKEFSNKDHRNKDYRSRKIADILMNRLIETVDQLVKHQKELTKEDLEDIKDARSRLYKILKR